VAPREPFCLLLSAHSARRYWSDEGGEKLNRHAEEKAGWRECIIHRDLKPDNMLLTNDWVLKLTDFGEARAVEANSRAAMTSVGTPIYMSPETMRGDHYTKTADSYSFAVVLMARVRGEATVQDYYIEALRKALKLKPGRGVGMSILTHRIYNKGWRPLLPLGFKTSYPNLSRLIQECWAQDPAKRPTFETIVARLQGPVAHEIR
jgi:serine/threonine protein kinase